VTPALTVPQLEQFVARLALTPELWQPFVRHAEDVRVYEQIWDAADVNAWLICWTHDQDTGFHDHHRSAAAISVVSGAVREERLRLGSAPRSRTISAGSAFTVPPVAIHRVLHAGDVPAVTLHAYSPPLTCTGAYRIGPDGELQRELMSLEDELRPAALSRA
jgi:mannose-6-phosphate isomerase-like protein (cupin superfamily)